MLLIFTKASVRGILEDRHKASLDRFITLLTEAGYRVIYELLNAADYKIPQDRFRVFFIGIRSDLKNKFEFPDAVSDMPVTLRQAIGDIVEEPRHYKDEQILEVNKQRANHDTYTESYDTKYMTRNRVRSWDETPLLYWLRREMHHSIPKLPKWFLHLPINVSLPRDTNTYI